MSMALLTFYVYVFAADLPYGVVRVVSFSCFENRRSHMLIDKYFACRVEVEAERGKLRLFSERNLPFIHILFGHKFLQTFTWIAPEKFLFVEVELVCKIRTETCVSDKIFVCFWPIAAFCFI